MSTNFLNQCSSDFERAKMLQDTMIAIATGSSGGEDDASVYMQFRHYFVANIKTKELLPDFVRTSRDVHQFWTFIKTKFSTYKERKEFIWQEFSKILEALENRSNLPIEKNVSMLLKNFDEKTVHVAWQKALDRRTTDPDGAITAARALLETVCKHILDAKKSLTTKKTLKFMNYISSPQKNSIFHLINTMKKFSNKY